MNILYIYISRQKKGRDTSQSYPSTRSQEAAPDFCQASCRTPVLVEASSNTMGPKGFVAWVSYSNTIWYHNIMVINMVIWDYD